MNLSDLLRGGESGGGAPTEAGLGGLDRLMPALREMLSGPAGRQAARATERDIIPGADLNPLGPGHPDRAVPPGGYGWHTLSNLGDPLAYSGSENQLVPFYREYMKRNPGITPEQALNAARRRLSGDPRYLDGLK